MRKFLNGTHLGLAQANPGHDKGHCFALDTDKAADQGHMHFDDSLIGDSGHGHIDHS